MSRAKDVLTTGEVARICKVAPRTVSKWFDSGKLRGYRIPGSKDRRIPMQQLIRFMRAHNIPLQELDAGGVRVLVIEQDRSVADLLVKALSESAGYEVCAVHSAFEAGAAAQLETPQVILLDVTMPGLNGRDGLRAIRNLTNLNKCKIIAMAGGVRMGEEIGFRQDGFDAVLKRPFDVPQVVQAIEEAIGAVGAA